MPETPPLPAQLSLHSGDTRVVELPGLAAAGYDWTAEVADGDLTIERLPPEAPEAAGEPALGASPPVRFRLLARGGGESHVRFVLARPWEDEPADLREMVVSVEP